MSQPRPVNGIQPGNRGPGPPVSPRPRPISRTGIRRIFHSSPATFMHNLLHSSSRRGWRDRSVLSRRPRQPRSGRRSCYATPPSRARPGPPCWCWPYRHSREASSGSTLGLMNGQPTSGLGGGTGRPRRRSRRTRIGDRAQHAGPGLEQGETDRPSGLGIAGLGQRVPQRVGHHLRYHDRDVRAAFGYAPPRKMATVKSRAARIDPGSGPSARGDPRRAGPARQGRIR